MTENPPLGSKLPAKYENPLDRVLIATLMPLMPYLHAMNITPNMLTAASAVCAAVSLYYFAKGRIVPALTFWFFNYMFDLADGLKARLYNQQSSLGCKFDHISDVLSVLGLYGVVWTKLRAGALNWQSLWPLVVEAFVVLIGCLHLTCQEKYSQARTSQYIPISGIDVKSCRNVELMKLTRWGGVATVTLWHMFLIVFYSAKV